MLLMVSSAAARADAELRDFACFLSESSTVCTSSTRLKPEQSFLRSLQKPKKVAARSTHHIHRRLVQAYMNACWIEMDDGHLVYRA